jgi:DNA (cytosine-5)-methyltransferase 1
MEHPTTIDLFCGAGGITEGFRQAGFRCLFANDFNANAVETFQYNHPSIKAVCAPIEKLSPKIIRKDLSIERGELDVLVGGPPCQGFSINAPERFVEDDRNAMFKHYVRFLEEFAPKQFLFENVPGMLSLAGGKIFRQIISELEQRGYRTTARILLSAHYGVPQVRWRLILLGTQGSRALQPPDPTHYFQARANFTGGSNMILRPLTLDQFRLLPAVTLRDAISDLPALKAGEGFEEMKYTSPPKSDFAREMRSESLSLFNHTANKLSQINLDRLKFIPPGGAWVDIPHELLPRGMKRARRSDHTKRYGRPKWESLSGTMMTKCDPHWGAVFHPDQQRAFTVREAARIQSFPDRYRFLGPRVSQYEQVGNAVPVLMARAIAKTILETLPVPNYVAKNR